MKHVVHVTQAADAELAAAQAYIAAHAPDEARRWVETVMRKLRSLRHYPRRCGRVPEAANGDGELRQLLVGLFRVLFLVEGRDVYVLTVRRTAQLPLSPSDLRHRMLERKPRHRHRKLSRGR